MDSTYFVTSSNALIINLLSVPALCVTPIGFNFCKVQAKLTEVGSSQLQRTTVEIKYLDNDFQEVLDYICMYHNCQVASVSK